MSNPCTIIVADDDEANRRGLRRSIEFFRLGAPVPAGSGAELRSQASTLLRERREVLLIVDNQMPNKPDEPESKWCGFEAMCDLAREFGDLPLGRRTLFLSRWGLEMLSTQQRQLAEAYGLASPDRWLGSYTPFTEIYARLIAMRRELDGK